MWSLQRSVFSPSFVNFMVERAQVAIAREEQSASDDLAKLWKEALGNE